MTRKECLDKAAECVLKDRQNQYGKPEDCFGMIARMWGAYLGVCVSAHDVAAMMALLKIARFRHNPFHEDNAVDCAGYAACMVETATAWEREGEDEAESGCCQDGKDQPEFKYGDRVQFRDEIPSTSEPHWFEGVYVERLSTGGHAVKFGPHGHVIHCSDKEIRPVQTPKAEGCEALVEKDAPQTKEELMQRIVDCNPATFKARTPTGEELAELAEEAEDD